jgi:predicted RNase H-like nuclease (RuvC/YqgF family)
VPANSFLQQIKQIREQNNETDQPRNRDFFTELRERISNARKSFKKTYNSTVAAFSNTIKRYRSDALELQADNTKLCRHSEKIGRDREAGDRFNADVTALKQHVERIERHKAYESDGGLSY